MQKLLQCTRSQFATVTPLSPFSGLQSQFVAHSYCSWVLKALFLGKSGSFLEQKQFFCCRTRQLESFPGRLRDFPSQTVRITTIASLGISPKLGRAIPLIFKLRGHISPYLPVTKPLQEKSLKAISSQSQGCYPHPNFLHSKLLTDSEHSTFQNSSLLRKYTSFD